MGNNVYRGGGAGLWKRALVCFLIFVMTVSVLSLGALNFVFADTYGTVNSTIGLNVRSGPGTGYSRIGGLNHNEKVTILSTEGEWYKIKFGSGTGYVFKDYIVLSSTPTPTPKPKPNDDEEDDTINVSTDADFEAAISKFPDSYKPYLRVLHTKYPKWKFVPQNTGLDWNSVITKQTQNPGVNLIHSSFASAYKLNSTVMDTGGYVPASLAAVKYYMDPRNFLNERSIFQFFTLKYDASTQTLAGLNKLVSGSFLSKSFPETTHASYVALLMEAGQQAGTNPLALASMIIQEQGYNGTGNGISGKVKGYEGYYNFFSIGAYAHSGRDAVVNGLIYAKGQGWNTRAKAIKGGALYFYNTFVKKNQDTLYLKRFNVMNGLSRVATNQYMTAVNGANSEGTSSSSGYLKGTAEDKNTAFTFNIPVYTNMPAKACPVPTSSSSSSGGTTTTPTIKLTEIRVAGANAYKTSEEAAKQLKSTMGVSKFSAIVLATGANYLDALSSTYIAATKNAPVILVNKNKVSDAAAYVKANLASGGTAYIIGGTAAIPSSMEAALSGIKTVRLEGRTAVDTNIEVLKAAGVKAQDILVCSSYSHYDALSASGVGKPILLVGKSLTDTQKNYLKSLSTKNIYIIGGTAAVNATVANQLKTYGSVTRVYGDDAFETSLAVARRFYSGTNKNMVIAYSGTYYDGVSAGPLAAKLKAPIILVSSKKYSAAKTYVKSASVKNVYVMGGTAAIPASVVTGISS